jgi:hypothetical protein
MLFLLLYIECLLTLLQLSARLSYRAKPQCWIHHSMFCCNSYFIWILFCLAHFQKKMRTPLLLTAPNHMVKRQAHIISVLFYFLNFIKELLVWQNEYSQCILMCKEPALVMSDLRTWWILIWTLQAYDLDRHRAQAYIHADTHIKKGTKLAE